MVVTASASLGRTLVWFVGLALVLAALVVLWDAAGLDRHLPPGFLIAIVLAIVGFAVIAAAHTMFPRRRIETWDEVRRGAPPPGWETPAGYPPTSRPGAVRGTRTVEEDERL